MPAPCTKGVRLLLLGCLGFCESCRVQFVLFRANVLFLLEPTKQNQEKTNNFSRKVMNVMYLISPDDKMSIVLYCELRISPLKITPRFVSRCTGRKSATGCFLDASILKLTCIFVN